jgi:hypothetical protein
MPITRTVKLAFFSFLPERFAIREDSRALGPHCLHLLRVPHHHDLFSPNFFLRTFSLKENVLDLNAGGERLFHHEV